MKSLIVIALIASITLQDCSKENKCLSCEAKICTMPILKEPFARMCKDSLDVKPVFECKTLRTTAQKVTGCSLYVTPTDNTSLRTTSVLNEKNGCLKCDTLTPHLYYVTKAETYVDSKCVKIYTGHYLLGYNLAAHATAKKDCDQVMNYQLKNPSINTGKENFNGCIRCKAGYTPTVIDTATNAPSY